jgi:hypothetical protein
VDGKDTYKIKLTKTGAPDVVFNVDASTYYIDKTSTSITANGQTFQIDITFSDYRKTPEGYVVPYSIKTVQPMGEIDSSVTKVVFNQPIDPKLFDKPGQ